MFFFASIFGAKVRLARMGARVKEGVMMMNILHGMSEAHRSRGSA
jgi:hypothetical protein